MHQRGGARAINSAGIRQLVLPNSTERFANAADLEQISADPPPWERRAVLQQRWSELAYFHWPYEPGTVQRLLPAGVRVDTFDGTAWVGLIPF